MTAVCMIYGATGYTGRLILEAALARGLRPVIAGRDERRVRGLAASHQLPCRAFSLEDPEVIAGALEDVDVVLNAAGPFTGTAERLAKACIAEGVDYLDICCERAVLDRLADLHETARQSGVALVPGSGFSPAVGEALAVHLTRRLPGTVRLVLALSAPIPPSPGLVRAGIATALRPSAGLRRGRLKTRRRRHVRRFDFGCGKRRCYALAWGELSAIHRATGVRNVDFFVQHRPDLDRLLRLPSVMALMRTLPPLRRRLESAAQAFGEGPSAGRRKRVRSRLAGFAYDRHGQRAVTRLHLPDPFTLTAELAATALARMMTEPVEAGVQTATQLLGSDLLSAIPGLPVDWEELELSAPGEVKLRIRRHVPWVERWIPGIGKLRGAPPGRLKTGGAMNEIRWRTQAAGAHLPAQSPEGAPADQHVGDVPYASAAGGEQQEGAAGPDRADSREDVNRTADIRRRTAAG